MPAAGRRRARRRRPAAWDAHQRRAESLDLRAPVALAFVHRSVDPRTPRGARRWSAPDAGAPRRRSRRPGPRAPADPGEPLRGAGDPAGRTTRPRSDAPIWCSPASITLTSTPPRVSVRSAAAEARMREINEAWDVLGEPAAEAAFDRTLPSSVDWGSGSPSAVAGPGPGPSPDPAADVAAVDGVPAVPRPRTTMMTTRGATSPMRVTRPAFRPRPLLVAPPALLAIGRRSRGDQPADGVGPDDGDRGHLHGPGRAVVRRRAGRGVVQEPERRRARPAPALASPAMATYLDAILDVHRARAAAD